MIVSYQLHIFINMNFRQHSQGKLSMHLISIIRKYFINAINTRARTQIGIIVHANRAHCPYK
jgi:hypothetical protein